MASTSTEKRDATTIVRKHPKACGLCRRKKSMCGLLKPFCMLTYTLYSSLYVAPSHVKRGWEDTSGLTGTLLAGDALERPNLRCSKCGIYGVECDFDAGNVRGQFVPAVLRTIMWLTHFTQASAVGRVSPTR